jgi:hypothetical protein
MRKYITNPYFILCLTHTLITHIEFMIFFRRIISFIKLDITTLLRTTDAGIVDTISLGGARVANEHFNVRLSFGIYQVSHFLINTILVKHLLSPYKYLLRHDLHIRKMEHDTKFPFYGDEHLVLVGVLPHCCH